MVRCKNCNHELWELPFKKDVFEHFTRYYFSHGMPYSDKKCYVGLKIDGITHKEPCGCMNPEPILITNIIKCEDSLK